MRSIISVWVGIVNLQRYTGRASTEASESGCAALLFVDGRSHGSVLILHAALHAYGVARVHNINLGISFSRRAVIVSHHCSPNARQLRQCRAR
jgi:hypothetical protein